jgi:hypothetical protein
VRSAEMIDPDRRIDEHARCIQRRRRIGSRFGSDPPRRPRRLALSRAMSAFKPSRTREVFSVSPVRREASRRSFSSIFKVVLICIVMHIICISFHVARSSGSVPHPNTRKARPTYAKRASISARPMAQLSNHEANRCGPARYPSSRFWRFAGQAIGRVRSLQTGIGKISLTSLSFAAHSRRTHASD